MVSRCIWKVWTKYTGRRRSKPWRFQKSISIYRQWGIPVDHGAIRLRQEHAAPYASDYSTLRLNGSVVTDERHLELARSTMIDKQLATIAEPRDRLHLPELPPDRPTSIALDNVQIPLLYRRPLQPRAPAAGRGGAGARGSQGPHASLPHHSCPVASNNAWRSPAPSSARRGCCSPTSPPATSTARWARK